MIWSASVLSSVSSDTEPTVVVTFDSAKYIFNAGECTGRAFMEGRRGWRNTKAVFLTSVGTQRASGLPGMFMLLADAALKKLDVVGPPGLAHYLASMRTYVYRAGIQVTPYEIESPSASASTAEPRPVYQDQLLTVYGIPLLPVTPGEISQTCVLEPDSNTQPLSSKRKRTPSPASAAKRKRPTDELPPPGSPAEGEPTLLQRSGNPDFMPMDLRGKDAQEWRHLVIESMFPYRKDVSEPIPTSNKEKGKARAKQGEGEAQAGGASITDTQAQAAASTSSDVSTKSPAKKALIGPRPKNRRLPPLPDGRSSPRFCYVCVGPTVRGKFDVQKATALGVPKGPLWGRLTRGEAVTVKVDDGSGGKVERTVQPEDCISPSEAPRVVIIIDITSPDQIPQLMSHFTVSPFYRRFRSKDAEDEKEYVVSTVFHLCGEHVLEDARYKEFMNGFAASVNHIVSSRKHAPDLITFGSAAFNLLRLNQLDPYMFPIPAFRKDPVQALAEIPDLPANTILMQAGLYTDVRPLRPPVLDEPIATHEIFHAAASSDAPVELPPSTLAAFDKVKARYAELQANEQRPSRPGDDVVVVPLGTNSALPNKYRNVSSTLIQIPGWGNVLLDAGEGTWGQLVRLFGGDAASPGGGGVWQALRDVKCIYLSHIHGDHHIGLAKILSMRKMLSPPPSDPLHVIGLRHVLLYLHELSDIEDLGVGAPDGNGVVPVLADALSWRRPAPYADAATMDREPWTSWEASRAAAADMCRALGLASFTTVHVNHGTRCYGAVLKHSDGWSIVFSADTLPTLNLASAGQNATLLIHEATMADDQQELARAKLHSTFSQALDIARKMKAENVLLTHFSARYPKMPQSEVAPPDAGTTDSTVQTQVSNSGPATASPALALAFDHMRIRIGDMRKINTYLPAIEQSFVETLEADDSEEPDPAKDPW